MTKYLFWEDSYLREFTGTILHIGGSNEMILDQTCFFASSGGQPSDSGTINGINVVSVKKGEDGSIVHKLEDCECFEEGQQVTGVIDWERRYRLMRLHSACHVVSGVMSRTFGVRKHTGIQIYEDRARMGFDMEKLDAEIGGMIEEEVNRVITEGHDIIARMLNWDEVARDQSLKTVSQDRYEKVEAPRVLDIVDFDRQLDGGTHVRNTREIGTIRVIGRENKGKNDKRIIFELAGKNPS